MRDSPLTEKERAAMDRLDMTPILGTMDERLKVAMDSAIRYMRERNALRAELQNVERMLDHANSNNDKGCAAGHCLVLSGFIPGIDDPCQCRECRITCKALDECGYLDRVAPEDRWWLKESDEDEPRRP